AYEAMDSGFGRHVAVGIFADDIERHGLDSGFFTVLIVEHLRFESVLLGPPQIHAHEHLGPVLRFGPAGTGMDIDDGVQAVLLTGKQNLRFDSIDERFSILQLSPEVVEYRFPLAGKLHERLHIVQSLGYLAIDGQTFFKAGTLL